VGQDFLCSLGVMNPKFLFPAALLTFIFQLSFFSSNAGDSCAYHMAKARDLMERGEYKTALPFIDRCLLQDPNNSVAYNLRGCATILQSAVNDEKNNRTALDFFNKALKYDSTNASYLNNRGWAWQNLDDLKKSYTDYVKAVRLDSNNVQLQGNVLRNLWIRNRNKEAYDYSNKLIAKFPDDGWAYHVRGELKRDYLHKYPEGNKDIKKGKDLGWTGGFNLMY
jgi:tetratricopeptide (TPR) repeat protein